MELSEQKLYQFQKIDADTSRRGIHSHAYHELYFIENSEVTYFIDNQIFPTAAGEMIFVPKGVMHYTVYEGELPVRRHLLFLTDREISREMQPYIDRLSQNYHIAFPLEQQHHVSEIYKMIQQEDNRDFPDKYLMTKILIEELLLLIDRHRIKEAKINMSNMQRIVQDTALYISKNMATDLSLETLSKRFSVSPSHLSKQFKNFAGIGLNEYINMTRIAAAENLLLNTHLSITEVAFQCGFNDSNYFTRVFKRIKGTTPKAYSMQR